MLRWPMSAIQIWAKSVESDEDKGRFEAKLGKLAKAKPEQKK